VSPVKPVILCDVDEVIAGLLPEWIRRYNEAFGKTVDHRTIDSWDLSTHCGGPEVYGILNLPDVYAGVRPIEGAQWGVEELRNLGYRVVFVSSCGAATAGQKMTWLHAHGFLPGVHSQKDLIIASDKSLVYGRVLIDDGPHNIEAFPGRTVLVDQPHNRSMKHPHRARSWAEIVDHVWELCPI
jgi:5'(3')-deoxyribonucleotidase